MLAPLQKQFNVFWEKQSKSQRIILITLILAAAVLIPVLVSWANTPSYSVAYSGLSETDASQIVQKMDEAGVTYRLRDSGTILVESDQVYEVRLKMARDGLPQSSTVGYELFDGNTLGMTEFTQRVNYQRALEGELERTIGSIDAVQAVRVHVVTPEKSLLASDQAPTTASITVQEKPGQALDAAQVRAMTHLVASSVEGLSPENVVVVDSNGNMLAGGAGNSMDASVAQSDTQRAAEVAAAAEIRKRVQAMLDSVLGPNKSIVQASVAMDWTQREVTSNIIAPTPIVSSEQHITESYTTDGSTIGGVPGAESNLPTPLPLTEGENGGVIYQRTENTVNYEVSQTQSHEVIAPGQISRVSLSVMVDGITDPDQLATIKAGVAAAAGIDETRGDMIVVEPFTFDRTYYENQQAEMSRAQQTDLYFQIGMGVAAALLLLVLFIYFGRLIRNMRRASQEAWTPILKPVSEMAALQPAAVGPSYAQFESKPQTEMIGPGPKAAPMKEEEHVAVELTSRYSANNTPEDDQRAKVIQRLAEESPATVAEIIQIWLSEDERNHG